MKLKVHRRVKNTDPRISSTKVIIKLTKKSGEVGVYRAGTLRRFFTVLRTAPAMRFNVLVTYGVKKDVFGKKVMFENQYIGESREEAIKALTAFLE